MSSASTPRAVADVTSGMLLACVQIDAPPERVFRALSTEEVAAWWGDPAQYRVTRWTGDVRVGGEWKSEGVGADGNPFSVSGKFIEVDPPRKLVQTWNYDWEEGKTTTLTYMLEPTATGTRLTVRHEGFGPYADSCRSHSIGWETVLTWLATHLSA